MVLAIALVVAALLVGVGGFIIQFFVAKLDLE
jgi:hypothetical protein